MAQDLVVAFAAVIVALLSAAITYVVQLVRKRWLLEELGQVLDRRTDMQNAADTETVHTLGAAHA
jgi:biopolymer transport protein ExbB/TolQ